MCGYNNSFCMYSPFAANGRVSLNCTDRGVFEDLQFLNKGIYKTQRMELCLMRKLHSTGRKREGDGFMKLGVNSQSLEGQGFRFKGLPASGGLYKI